MAKKRMFDIDIINQDSFFDLPMDAKALYFLLGMEADDEGFVSPKRVLRLYGGTEDSLKVLATEPGSYTITYHIASKTAPKVCPACGHDQGYFIEVNEILF